MEALGKRLTRRSIKSARSLIQIISQSGKSCGRRLKEGLGLRCEALICMISVMTLFIYYYVCFYSAVSTGAFLRFAKIIPQAGDGSCLFHSLSYGIKDDTNASILRYDISTYIQQHPHTLICDTPLSDWVKWDSNTSCTEYSRRMKNGAWGMHSIIVVIVIVIVID